MIAPTSPSRFRPDPVERDPGTESPDTTTRLAYPDGSPLRPGDRVLRRWDDAEPVRPPGTVAGAPVACFRRDRGKRDRVARPSGALGCARVEWDDGITTTVRPAALRRIDP